MPIKQQIEKDFINALKNKKEFDLSVLRSLKSEIKNKEIQQKGELSDSEITGLLKTEKKKRLDSIEAYKSGGRDDLADKEQKEIEIIETYLPKQFSEDQIKQIIIQAREELGDQKDNFGILMKTAMSKMNGQADGQVVSRLVKQIMSD